MKSILLFTVLLLLVPFTSSAQTAMNADKPSGTSFTCQDIAGKYSGGYKAAVGSSGDIYIGVSMQLSCASEEIKGEFSAVRRWCPGDLPLDNGKIVGGNVLEIRIQASSQGGCTPVNARFQIERDGSGIKLTRLMDGQSSSFMNITVAKK